jgi:hypothetical protein
MIVVGTFAGGAGFYLYEVWCQRGDKRGSYKLKPSVRGYCSHLRDMPAARGVGDAHVARARLGQAQADLATGSGAQTLRRACQGHTGHDIPVWLPARFDTDQRQ